MDKLSSHEQMIQDTFAYGDEWAYEQLIKAKNDLKYIKIARPFSMREKREKDVAQLPLEYMWKYHSLIELPNKEAGLTVMGIGFYPAGDRDEVTTDEEWKYAHPKGSARTSSGEINTTLEPTRRNTIRSVEYFLKQNKFSQNVKYLLQFDLAIKATKRANDLDLTKLSVEIEMLKRALKNADFIVIAWGNKGQAFLNKAPKLKKQLKKLLEGEVAKNKLLWVGKTEANGARSILYTKTGALKKMTSKELEELLG